MNQLMDRIQRTVLRSSKPMSYAAIGGKAGIGKQRSKELKTVLDELTKKGTIVLYNGRYGSPKVMGITPAEIVKVTGTFGFAKPIDTEGEDLFIPGRFLMGTMPGDRVLVKVARSHSGGQLTEGSVVTVLEEVNRAFSGTLVELSKGRYGIEADKYVNFMLPLASNAPVVGQNGDKVLAAVRHRGQRHNAHTVEILQVFGSGESAYNCSLAILGEQGIIPPFPEDVLDQAKALAGAGIHPKEISQRLDLRRENIFTIDGADTKDIDDAISITPLADGWELGVHIADVSYYVTRNSPLDNQAFTRGTSVYYADQVVPMLPPELSNGICSLNPGEDRLAFSAYMKLSKQGKILSYTFKKSVIQSQIKGVYSEINEILESPEPSKDILKKYHNQLESLGEMKKLYHVLQKNRAERNAINLESTESRIVVDESGKAVDIVPRVSGITEGIIEEFMLVANQSAASFALEKQIPFIFRVHDSPAPDRLEALFLLLDSLGVGYQRPRENQSPGIALDAVLEKVKDTPLAGIVNYSVLRTMAKAEYSDNNQGHFGLALDKYAHFTSPIRRYPDLAIHRVMSSFVTGMRRENIEKYYRGWVGEAAKHSTEREIASMVAERSAEDCYKAEYMSQFIGEKFQGVVSSATSFGIFVQLESTVEGLIHGDYFPAGRWVYDNLITYQNDVGGEKIHVGDTIEILVEGTNVPQGQIDFRFAQPEKYSPPHATTSEFTTVEKIEKAKEQQKNKRPYTPKGGSSTRTRRKGRNDKKR